MPLQQIEGDLFPVPGQAPAYARVAANIDSLKLRRIFPVFMNDENSAAMKAYDPDRMPSLFVIDPKGTVQLVEYGYNKGDEDKLCAKLLELTK